MEMNPTEIRIHNIVLPNKPLTNEELRVAVRDLEIPFFRGVFLRDTLPQNPDTFECGIFNLCSLFSPGTHWVCWWKKDDLVYYFDSFGLNPPTEFIDYCEKNDVTIFYSTEQIQPKDQVFCGHLCLYVLKEVLIDGDFQRVINSMY